jgi:hypothetical protein
VANIDDLQREPASVVALAGLQLTRKAVFCERARARGYVSVSVGDYVRQRDTKLREPEVPVGGAAIKPVVMADEILLDRVLSDDPTWQRARRLVIDSVKSEIDVRYLVTRFTEVAVVACLAPLRQRWLGALERNRADAPSTLDAFIERDEREISLGLGSLVIRADFFFIAGDREISIERADAILDAIENPGNDGR